MSSQYRSEKDGENIGIIVDNKLINGLEINLLCVIITFNHKFLVFNVCCGPRSSMSINCICIALLYVKILSRLNKE